MGTSPSIEFYNKPIAVTPFWCKCCYYIWDTKKDFLRHLNTSDPTNLANKLYKQRFDPKKDKIPKKRCTKIVVADSRPGEICLRKHCQLHT